MIARLISKGVSGLAEAIARECGATKGEAKVIGAAFGLGTAVGIGIATLDVPGTKIALVEHTHTIIDVGGTVIESCSQTYIG
jgi:hypothetical protein